MYFLAEEPRSGELEGERDHTFQHNNLDKLSPKELLDEIRKEAAELGILIVDPSAALPKPNGGKKKHRGWQVPLPDGRHQIAARRHKDKCRCDGLPGNNLVDPR
jgi:peptidoglycan/xylan/chitin deacetylase (PgdA/CDA1 family)